MNPSELRMMLMSHYNPERISLEDATSYFGQPSLGLSLVDELAHHSAGAMNMNPMMSIVGGEYGGHQAAALAAAAAAAAAQGATGTALAQAPSHALITANPELYGIPNVGSLQHLLQQQASGPFTNYSAMADDDDIMDTGGGDGSGGNNNNSGIVDENINNSSGNTGNERSGNIGNSDNQQNYEQIDDNDYDSTIMHDNREVINIDDFILMDNDENDNDNDNDNENSNSFDDIVLTQPTKPTNRKTRKIEPVNRPGLVLKTPIAYRGNIDPSVIPIQRDGMAVCERCGAIGVKHTFYTKSRRYCSMACARGELFNLVSSDLQNSNINNLSNIEMTSSTSKPVSIYNNNFNSQIANNSASGHISINSGSGNVGVVGDNTKDGDVELELQVSQIKNNNYRFKIACDEEEQVNHQQQQLQQQQQQHQQQQQQQQLQDQQQLQQQTSTILQQQFNGINNENGRNSEIMSPKSILYRDVLPQDDVPQIPKSDRLPSPCPQDEKICSIRRKRTDTLHTFDWIGELSKPNFFAAPVTCFPHAPGFDMWDNIGIDMKVEVENTDCDNILNIQPGQTPHSFWVATVLNICGYKALMRYEGFDDDSHDFWVNLCSSEVHPVGWCATRGKPLIPPKSIENKYSDWKEFLVTRLSGARTLPSNFYNKIADSFKSRFRCGLNLECVDKNRISQVKLATVHKIVGKRLYVKYYDAPDDGFWCHEDAPIIHPVGWATTVGHTLAAPQDYLDRMIAGQEQMIEMHEDDAPIELFKMNFTFEEYYLDGKTNCFVKGMKLEAVDPLNLSSICVATVMSVLKFGYMMIRIDSYDPDETGSDWFCYHEKSPSIFPVGFCVANNIQLTPPHGYDQKTFAWDTYLAETRSLPAQQQLFDRTIPEHGFEIGMKLECADLMDPRLVCVATIARIVGRLLKVSFDGWPEEYDQWLDCESPDFYPVGWCVLVDHKLEGPPVRNKPQITQKPVPKNTKKKKRKPNYCGRGRPPNIKREGNESRSASRNSQNSSASSNRLSIKLEMKNEPHEDDMDEYEFEDDEEELTSGKSRSEQSTPLLCSGTPEPPHGLEKSKSNGSSNLNISNVQKSTSPAPPTERKATSYISNTSVSSSKYIPRLIDLQNESNNSNTSALSSTNGNSNELLPYTWNIHDVSQFLRVNDLAAYCDAFSRSKVDGKNLLELTKDEIVSMLCMKVGPALKIYDLIQQLKSRINPNRSKLLKANNNKKFL